MQKMCWFHSAHFRPLTKAQSTKNKNKLTTLKLKNRGNAPIFLPFTLFFRSKRTSAHSNLVQFSPRFVLSVLFLSNLPSWWQDLSSTWNVLISFSTFLLLRLYKCFILLLYASFPIPVFHLLRAFHNPATLNPDGLR